ncbi:RING-type E3 ubiquitin transferase [Quillaja saponaria]|uniref:RING-type E3 ubiquitin transferase n=1 Tax=Quillaja saponaria TaxID=32244 RepID=A0AAD7LXT5_QUISA|nr:RING-type E3 ubiquitin transferase [Quillaja saponaria]
MRISIECAAAKYITFHKEGMEGFTILLQHCNHLCVMVPFCTIIYMNVLFSVKLINHGPCLTFCSIKLNSARKKSKTMSAAQLRDAITECLSQTLSDSEEAQQKALRMLAFITKVSPQNRSLLAQTDGAIPTFLSLTKSSSPRIQTLSLSILFNLSLNPDLKLSLADMETIYRLNSMITSPSSPESSQLASSLICSLAMLDKNKAKFGVTGTVQLLVNAISGQCGPAAHHLLSSLAEIVQFQGNCTLAVRSGAVPVLLQVVESSEGEDLAGTSLAILGLLARFNEGLNALKKTDQIVNSMLKVLKGRCMMSKEGAAEILFRLFDENESCVRDAMKFSDFSTVLADLSVRGSARARDKAALLMKKIMAEANLNSYMDSHPFFL